MSMKTSLDWQNTRSILSQNISKLGRKSQDLQRILDNIDPLITKLSQIEVGMRARGQGHRQHQDQLALINQRIADLEHLITLASLM